jgi:hypothetical protein
MRIIRSIKMAYFGPGFARYGEFDCFENSAQRFSSVEFPEHRQNLGWQGHNHAF